LNQLCDTDSATWQARSGSTCQFLEKSDLKVLSLQGCRACCRGQGEAPARRETDPQRHRQPRHCRGLEGAQQGCSEGQKVRLAVGRITIVHIVICLIWGGFRAKYDKKDLWSDFYKLIVCNILHQKTYLPFVLSRVLTNSLDCF